MCVGAARANLGRCRVIAEDGRTTAEEAEQAFRRTGGVHRRCSGVAESFGSRLGLCPGVADGVRGLLGQTFDRAPGLRKLGWTPIFLFYFFILIKLNHFN